MLAEGVLGDGEVEVDRESATPSQSELADRTPALEHDILGVAREEALANHPLEEVLLGELEEGELPTPPGVVARDEPQLSLGDHATVAAPTGSSTLKRLSRRADGVVAIAGTSGTETRDRPSSATPSARSSRPKTPAR